MCAHPKSSKSGASKLGAQTKRARQLKTLRLCGAHWESRQLGAEVMSYGTLSGEVFLSDLTLAFLEDTGHYIANYSNAGHRITIHKHW